MEENPVISQNPSTALPFPAHLIHDVEVPWSYRHCEPKIEFESRKRIQIKTFHALSQGFNP